jgi:hypothetical protein
VVDSDQTGQDRLAHRCRSGPCDTAKIEHIELGNER